MMNVLSHMLNWTMLLTPLKLDMDCADLEEVYDVRFDVEGDNVNYFALNGREIQCREVECSFWNETPEGATVYYQCYFYFNNDYSLALFVDDVLLEGDGTEYPILGDHRVGDMLRDLLEGQGLNA